MDYINHSEIAYCTVFELKLTQDELEVYERSMKYLVDNLDEKSIYEITGCTIEELKAFTNNIRKLIINHVRDEIIPDAYKDEVFEDK